MNDINRGQVIRSAAEVYDEFFLPALFVEWTNKIVAAAQIEKGQAVLDVACGTGVLTLAAANSVGPTRKGNGAGHKRGNVCRSPNKGAGI